MYVVRSKKIQRLIDRSAFVEDASYCAVDRKIGLAVILVRLADIDL